MIVFSLIITHWAAYLIGRWIRRRRDRHEVQRACNHPAKHLAYIDDFDCYICNLCGTFFEFNENVFKKRNEK